MMSSPDDNFFIIRPRYQSVFGVGGNWTPDLLYITVFITVYQTYNTCRLAAQNCTSFFQLLDQNHYFHGKDNYFPNAIGGYTEQTQPSSVCVCFLIWVNGYGTLRINDSWHFGMPRNPTKPNYYNQIKSWKWGSVMQPLWSSMAMVRTPLLTSPSSLYIAVKLWSPFKKNTTTKKPSLIGTNTYSQNPIITKISKH